MDRRVVEQRIAQMSPEDLLREVLVRADEYTPEALAAYRAALERRVRALDEVMATARQASGRVEHEVRVRAFTHRDERVVHGPNRLLGAMTGRLLLSTTGVGFVGDEVERVFTPAHAIVGAWLEHALRERPTDGRGLPVALLARLVDTAWFVPRGRLRSIGVDGAAIELHADGACASGGLVDRAEASRVIAWRDAHGVAAAPPARGLLGWLLGR